jgi:hypothetical protein
MVSLFKTPSIPPPSGNTISGAGSDCIILVGVSAVAYNTVVGNNGQGCGGTGIDVAVQVSGGVTGNSFIGNTLIGNAGDGIASTAQRRPELPLV